jgi:hypothetical protein
LQDGQLNHIAQQVLGDHFDVFRFRKFVQLCQRVLAVSTTTENALSLTLA